MEKIRVFVKNSVVYSKTQFVTNLKKKYEINFINQYYIEIALHLQGI